MERFHVGGPFLFATNFANKVWALCSLKCCFLIAAILYNRHQVVGKRKKKHYLVKNGPKCSYIMYENGKPISVLDPLFIPEEAQDVYESNAMTFNSKEKAENGFFSFPDISRHFPTLPDIFRHFPTVGICRGKSVPLVGGDL